MTTDHATTDDPTDDQVESERIVAPVDLPPGSTAHIAHVTDAVRRLDLPALLEWIKAVRVAMDAAPAGVYDTAAAEVGYSDLWDELTAAGGAIVAALGISGFGDFVRPSWAPDEDDDEGAVGAMSSHASADESPVEEPPALPDASDGPVVLIPEVLIPGDLARKVALALVELDGYEQNIAEMCEGIGANITGSVVNVLFTPIPGMDSPAIEGVGYALDLATDWATLRERLRDLASHLMAAAGLTDDKPEWPGWTFALALEWHRASVAFLEPGPERDAKVEHVTRLERLFGGLDEGEFTRRHALGFDAPEVVAAVLAGGESA